jgi:hypothetical protein
MARGLAIELADARVVHFPACALYADDQIMKPAERLRVDTHLNCNVATSVRTPIKQFIHDHPLMCEAEMILDGRVCKSGL